ncbi:DUF1345 domain-containing protein [Amycolatopsis sp. PS_44_ISF1]|uniref:DUF1345 domain-containing protein n=1 Tax=Amycolatopsis sp. PS_44_ISF1 TaxID=2974917 RepID=UPI0028DD5B99|nr:DUF1345 domain-containing protein [Amycolatopsis sp. PS_44_ISF1]MDT8912019.1 DUF1345 domain-containing protein [Amycolatopsis sp. PS_44_ISF1]
MHGGSDRRRDSGPRWWHREWCRQVIALVPGVLGALAFDSLAMQYLIGWDLFAPTYLVLTWLTYRHRDAAQVRALTAALQPGKMTNLLLGRTSQVLPQSAAVIALVASMGVLPSAIRQHTLSPPVLILGLAAVVTGWVAVQASFTVVYLTTQAEHGGLRFPGDEEWATDDILYFAVAVGTTFGTTDVEVTSRAMRRKVLVHGLYAFVFNTLIVAAAVSIVTTFATQ